MRTKRITVVLITLLISFALISCGQSGKKAAAGGADQSETEKVDDTVYTFVVNLNKPEASSNQDKIWMNAISEQSGGRIEFETYYSSSLLNVKEVPEGLDSGTIDIACAISMAEFPTILPLTAGIMTMPFSGIKGEDFYEVYDRLMKDYPVMVDEYTNAGMVPLTYGFGAGVNLFLGSENNPVTAPSELKGKQIMATHSTLQKLISKEGGAPVSAGPPDFYSYLERSVSDGIFNHWGVIVHFSVFEVVKQAFIFGNDSKSGLTYDLFGVVMSQKKWDSLPADIRQIFMDNRELYYNEQKKVISAMGDKGINLLTEKGAAITYLNDNQIKVWQDEFGSVRDEILGGLDSKGLNATEIYTRMLEINRELK